MRKNKESFSFAEMFFFHEGQNKICRGTRYILRKYNFKEFRKVIFHKQQSKKNLERLTGKTDRECQQKYEADSRHHPHSNDVQLYDEIIERLECNAKDWNITLSRVGDLQ